MKTTKYIGMTDRNVECMDGQYNNPEFRDAYHDHVGNGRVFAFAPGSNSGHAVGQAFNQVVLDHLGGTPNTFHRGVDAWGIKFSTRGLFKKVTTLGVDYMGNTPTVYKHKTKPILLITSPTWSRYAGRFLVVGETI
jgi:hypothetical protein